MTTDEIQRDSPVLGWRAARCIVTTDEIQRDSPVLG